VPPLEPPPQPSPLILQRRLNIGNQGINMRLKMGIPHIIVWT
jgi:hypothetical protein